MSTHLVITFPETGTPSSDLTHRVRNFAEDLERSLSSAGVGSVRNADTATTEVWARVTSSAKFGEAASLARAAAKRHHLEQSANFERAK